MNTCIYNSPVGTLKISEDKGKIIGLYLHQEQNISDDGNCSQQKQWSQHKQQNLQNQQCQHELHNLQSRRRHQEQQGHEQCCHGKESELLQEACRQLDEYFQGKRKNFDLPIGYTGTPFQEKVWRELQNIPYGETRSYADIAVKIGSPGAVRAVG